jgi:hypothetical protein
VPFSSLAQRRWAGGLVTTWQPTQVMAVEWVMTTSYNIEIDDVTFY